MTVEPLRYTVKPTSGTIPPGTSVEVEVVLKALPDPAAIVAFLASKQKFMIQWRALSPNVEPAETGINLVSARYSCVLHIVYVLFSLICLDS